tara:strand:- start:145 stop:456 length:312 start_codon:yes stop_codon:yes gene_type:complete
MWKRWRRLHLASLRFLIIPKRRMLIRGAKQLCPVHHRCNIFALGFVTGLFGANVASIPGLEWPWAFASLCLSLVSNTALAVLIFETIRHLVPEMDIRRLALFL